MPLTKDEFAQAVEECQGNLRSRFYKLCRGDKQRTEDILQATFLKALRSLDSFEGRSSVYGWLYRIAYNTLLDEERARKRHPEFVTYLSTEGGEEADIYDSCSSPANGPLEHLIEAAELAPWKRAVACLTKDHRRVVELLVSDFSYEEIAEMLNIPKGTVMSRLYYARNYLAEILGMEKYRENGRHNKRHLTLIEGGKSEKSPQPAVPVYTIDASRSLTASAPTP
ncbi:MAG: RNA polymerase sigma factor [Alphaproteobacteria bacterium]|nr:RNA polymerase sigma factor [Alphaproteobacteria bacterium]